MGVVPQVQSLQELQQVPEGGDVGVGQPQAWLWAWVILELVSPGCWGCSPQASREASSPKPMASVPVFPAGVGWGTVGLGAVGRGGRVLLLQLPVRGRRI